MLFVLIATLVASAAADSPLFIKPNVHVKLGETAEVKFAIRGHQMKMDTAAIWFKMIDPETGEPRDLTTQEQRRFRFEAEVVGDNGENTIDTARRAIVGKLSIILARCYQSGNYVFGYMRESVKFRVTVLGCKEPRPHPQ